MIYTNLTNHFLIAMPGLHDPNFEKTVTYICEHTSEHGAMGIIINSPLDIPMSEILEQLDIDHPISRLENSIIYLGGPVSSDRGFVLHESTSTRWDSTLVVKDGISITTSRDILQAIARGKGPEKRLLALGYAGWSPGQLEQELAANAWLCGPADEAIIFDQPASQRWQAAARDLGVDLSLLSTETGHA